MVYWIVGLLDYCINAGLRLLTFSMSPYSMTPSIH